VRSTDIVHLLRPGMRLSVGRVLETSTNSKSTRG
jgi:hypothetical protein